MFFLKHKTDAHLLALKVIDFCKKEKIFVEDFNIFQKDKETIVVMINIISNSAKKIKNFVDEKLIILIKEFYKNWQIDKEKKDEIVFLNVRDKRRIKAKVFSEKKNDGIVLIFLSVIDN